MDIIPSNTATGRVTLIDPNDQIAVNSGTPNGTPAEELLRPYVSLSVYRRRGPSIAVGTPGPGSTVLSSDENGRFTTKLNTDANVRSTVITEGETLRVNMLDFDPVKGYTESYLDDVVGRSSRSSIGGFGIRSISIKLNANYVPEVSITFLDLHGGSLFRAGSEGPLAVLYDFPPPLYKLKMKGAYGKYVEYDLHPLSETNRFGGGVANSPEITVKFIGQYFGPMTDVLLGYLTSVAYLRGTGIVGVNTLAPNKNTPPSSYFDLVQRGKLLYTVLDEFKSESPTVNLNAKWLKTQNQLKALDTQLAGLLEPLNLTRILNENLRADAHELMDHIRVNPGATNITPGIVSIEVSTEALAAYEAAKGVNGVARKAADGIHRVFQAFSQGVLVPLSKDYGILGEGTPLERKLDFLTRPVESKLYTETLHSSDHSPFVGVYDFTQLTKLLGKLNADAALQGEVAYAAVHGAVQGRTNQVLGIRPTVGAITKLICDDYDYFLERIRQAGITPKADATNRQAQGARAVGKLAWPTVYEARPFVTDPSQTQEVLRYPGLYPDFASWPEVQFVEDYCRASVQAAADNQRTDFVRANLDRHNYAPISSLEQYGQRANTFLTNPYFEIGTLAGLVEMMTTRYLFCQDYAYAQVFHVAGSCTPNTVVGKFLTLLTTGVIQQALRFTGYDANARDRSDKAVYGLVDAYYGGNNFPSQSRRQQLIERIARLDARNAARGIKGDKTVTDAVLAMSQATPAQLVQILNGGSQSQDATHLLAREANVITPSLNLGGTTIHYRGGQEDALFSGIADIIPGDSTLGVSLHTPKSSSISPPAGSAAVVDPVDADDTKFLEGLGEAFLNAGQKAVVSQANLLMFPDVDAQPNGPGKDFFSDFFQARKYNPPGIIETVIGYFAVNGGYDTTKPPPVLASLHRIMYLMDSQVRGLYVRNKFSSEMFGRFFYPGAIEMPTWYVLMLAYRSRGSKYDPDNNSFTPWDHDNAPVSDLDTARLQKFELEFVAADGITKLIQSFLDANTKALKVNGSVADLVRTLSIDPAWKNFMAPVYVINTSTLTFLRLVDNLQVRVKDPTYGPGFRSLTTGTGTDAKLRTPFVLYATAFWQELQKELKEAGKAELQAQNGLNNPFNDPDFKTQLYYSFKALYDRWLAGMEKPLKPLYESFKFITRSYQDISQECVVDFKSLLDHASSPDVGVYSGISVLLQQNGFLFFPLHSFVDFGTSGSNGKSPLWGGNFSVVDKMSDQTTARAAFVCMLAGAYSSQLSNADNKDHPDDGFEFGPTQPLDFNKGGPVLAFRVRAGMQNQSIFGEPQIDSAEFKNTDVSLKLQDEIINAQSKGTYQIRKSQNLLNVYAQRSYSCSITVPMGNMCLQPTQYFQLDGVNLYRGAYMIQQVTHEYSAENQVLVTNFKGMRMGRYVFNVVNDPLLDYVGAGLGPNANSITSLSLGQNGSPKEMLPGRLVDLCEKLNYPLAMVKAIIFVEAAGNPAFNKQTNKCLTRFEPSHFYRSTKLLVGAKWAVDEQGNKLRRNGRFYLHETCHKDQFTEYAAIEEATGLTNQETAYGAASWGRGQVMGANFAGVGFPNAVDMVAHFQASEEGQIQAMLNFIEANPRSRRAMHHLPKPDFAALASVYNGANYRVNNYDVLLEQAYDKFLIIESNTPTVDLVMTLSREQRLSDRIIGNLTYAGNHICYILEYLTPTSGASSNGISAIAPGRYELAISNSAELKRATVTLKALPKYQDGQIRLQANAEPAQSVGCLITCDKPANDAYQPSLAVEQKVTDIVRGLLQKGKVFLTVGGNQGLG